MRLSGREARLANRLARRESNSDSSTRDTSHLCSSTLSASATLQSSLGNRLRQQLQNRGCAIYKLTWKEKTTPSGLPYSQLVASAHRTIPFGMADPNSERLQRERRDSYSQGRKRQNIRQAGLLDGAGSENNTTNPHHGFWSDTDWLGCRDGKFRPVEPGAFPLANGIPARVGRLRGYGNAIVPQVAAEFIKAFMGAVNE